MKKLIRLALVAATASAMFFAPNASQASDTNAVALVGTASISPGLRYPGATDDLTNSAAWPSATYSFSAGVACTDDAGVSCTISVSGQVKGFCGWSTAPRTGSGSYTSSNGQTHTVSNVGWTQSAGGTILVDGLIGGTPFTAVIEAAPTTGSCASGTATGFTIAGAAVINP